MDSLRVPVWVVVIVVAVVIAASVGGVSYLRHMRRSDVEAAANIAEETPILQPDEPAEVAEPPISVETPTAEKAPEEESPVVLASNNPCDRITQYDRSPQPQIGHPSFYAETGIGETACWELVIHEGFVAIVGGNIVDGVGDGVYKAIKGSKTVIVKVTDGFVAIIQAEGAQAEFCFRLFQAERYGWAHNTVQPLSDWSPCETTDPVVPQPTTTAACQRQETGKGNKTLSFSEGDTVVGYRITLESGSVCEDTEGKGKCWLKEAPEKGTVTDGVICPFLEEIPDTEPWDPNS